MNELKNLLVRDDIPPDAKKLIQREINKFNKQLKSEKEALKPLKKEKSPSNSKEKLQSLIDASFDYIMILNLEYKIQFLNRAAPGASIEELIGIPLYTLVETEHQGRIKGYLDDVVKTRKAVRYETSYQQPDGEVIYYETVASPIVFNDVVTGLTINSRDMTDSKLTLRRLQLSETRYRRLFDESPVPLLYQDFTEVFERLKKLKESGITDFQKYFFDNPDKIRGFASLIETLDANQAAIELYKAKHKNELLGSIDNLFIDQSYEIFEKQLIDFTDGKMEFSAETYNQNLEGEILIINLSLSVASDYEPPTFRGNLSTIDITERKKIEKHLEKKTTALERSNQALQQFAYATSHDLQEPLRTIVSFLQLLERRLGEDIDAEAKKYLDYAVDGSIRMRELIDDLLTYSRLGKGDRTFTSVSLSQVLEKVLKNLKGVINKKYAEVKNSKLPNVNGDEAQFILLLQNLIENSIKFKSDKKLKIEVSAEETPTTVIIKVKDNGIGI
ncbi:MAG: PAS domain S-box protein, partial [Candidatus Heimdallarchaeota archaeon]|nr:PAS domain S-box protein [Candidatus Heimdallarchaeota archaeon]